MARVKNNLKNTHPQKFCLKLICDWLYYFGAGLCWYEEPVLTKKQKCLYMIWSFISNSYIVGGFFNQYIALFRSDLTDTEKEDLYFNILGHSTIFAKYVILRLQKNRIKVLFKSFLEDNREYSSLDIEKQSLKSALLFSLVFCFGVFTTLGFTLGNAVKAHFQEGIPIRTEVTFYPKNTTPSIPFNIVRVLAELHWYYVVTIMILIDSLCVCSLVFLGHKFKYLQRHFKGLRKNFLDNSKMKSRSVLEKEYEKGVLVGIKLHQHTLWCARSVQYALGNNYSLVVVESLILSVGCLMQMVAAVHNLSLFLTYFIFFFCVVLVTGAYMMAGGAVTTEAGLIATSIFHSGWELNRARKSLRTLLVIALVNSQVPVLMTAFGIITLSYSNFLMILRHSYSFFAVMYRNTKV